MKQSRTTTLLIGAAAIVIVIAGLRSAAGIVGPVVLALSITIVFHPLRARLERRLPVWAASVVVLIAAYTLIVLMTLAMIISVGQLAALVPTYAPQINDLVTGAGTGSRPAASAPPRSTRSPVPWTSAVWSTPPRQSCPTSCPS